jgi:Zn-dependent protease
MKWSLSLGRWFGIPVYLHFTFLMVLGFLVLTHWLGSRSVTATLAGAGFFAAIFACVLLHEFGHALMARRYGIGTKDITLLPIGGLARLERMPDKPVQELWIAVAGPAVNVAIVAGLAFWLLLTNTFEPVSSLSATQGSLIERLMMVNGFLVLFNLLPAFPMDGGRVLRSLLAMRMDYAQATSIAGRLGQGMALVFAFLGLFTNPMLLLIALFVWIGAAQEMHAAETRSVLAGVTVGQAMITDYRSLSGDERLEEVARLVLDGSQQDFPVVQEGHITGLLERRHLLDGLTRLGPAAQVSEVMVREVPMIPEDEALEELLARNLHQEFSTLPVVSGHRVVGLFTVENLTELLLLKSALEARPSTTRQGKAWNVIVSRPSLAASERT